MGERADWEGGTLQRENANTDGGGGLPVVI